MSAAAISQPCQGCGKHFVGVVPGLCPACEKDSAFYKATRKKGDPRQFLPYPELLDQWRRRRAECRDWKKTAGQAATQWTALQQVAKEHSYLLAALTALDADLDPALELAAELEKTREELARVTALAAALQEQLAELQAGKPDAYTATMAAMDDWLRLAKSKAGIASIPPEQWRRLVQLVHPDKHAGSAAAMEATRWLLENRP